MNHQRTTTRAISIAILAATIVSAILLSGCSGAVSSGPKHKADDLTNAWKTSPEAANWDLEVRNVITQKKSTGSHDAQYTVFLTTFTSKKVPSFKMYQTVDVPDDDSMTFEERSTSFFNAIAAGTQFSGVQDTEVFMKWFAEKYANKYFVRLIQNTGADGKSTWELVALDEAPTASTMTGDIGKTGLSFTYDPATKSWAEATSP